MQLWLKWQKWGPSKLKMFGRESMIGGPHVGRSEHYSLPKLFLPHVAAALAPENKLIETKKRDIVLRANE